MRESVNELEWEGVEFLSALRARAKIELEAGCATWVECGVRMKCVIWVDTEGIWGWGCRRSVLSFGICSSLARTVLGDGGRTMVDGGVGG